MQSSTAVVPYWIPSMQPIIFFFWSFSKHSKRANSGRDFYSDNLQLLTAANFLSSSNILTACGWNRELSRNGDGIINAGNGDPIVHSFPVREGLDVASELTGRGSTFVLTSLSFSFFCLLARFWISAASAGLCGGLLRGMVRTSRWKSECG